MKRQEQAHSRIICKMKIVNLILVLGSDSNVDCAYLKVFIYKKLVLQNPVIVIESVSRK